MKEFSKYNFMSPGVLQCEDCSVLPYTACSENVDCGNLPAISQAAMNQKQECRNLRTGMLCVLLEHRQVMHRYLSYISFICRLLKQLQVM